MAAGCDLGVKRAKRPVEDLIPIFWAKMPKKLILVVKSRLFKISCLTCMTSNMNTVCIHSRCRVSVTLIAVLAIVIQTIVLKYH